MEYRVFKNELMNYKTYKENINKLENEIDDIFYKYSGVRGIRYDKQQSSYNETLFKNNLHKMMKELEKPQRDLEFTKEAIKRIETNMYRLPLKVRQMTYLLFVEDKTFLEVGQIYGYSHTGIHRLIKKEIEKL